MSNMNGNGSLAQESDSMFATAGTISHPSLNVEEVQKYVATLPG